jgi:hypothetical protein
MPSFESLPSREHAPRRRGDGFAPQRPVAPVLQLQHRAGNRATARLLSGARLLQRVVFPDMQTMWRTVHPGFEISHVKDSRLKELYNDAAKQLPVTDFVYQRGAAPAASDTPAGPRPYRVVWSRASEIGWDGDRFAGAVIHELVHVATRGYRRNFIPGADVGDLVWANLNLPPAQGAADQQSGLAQNQLASLRGQLQTLRQNWVDLEAEADADFASGVLRSDYSDVVHRIDAMEAGRETVKPLRELMIARKLDHTVTYRMALGVQKRPVNAHPRWRPNWEGLRAQAELDMAAGRIRNDYAHMKSRFRYVDSTGPLVHNEAVLADIMYYLKAKGLEGSRTYKFAGRMLGEANARRRMPWLWGDQHSEVERVDRAAKAYELHKW